MFWILNHPHLIKISWKIDGRRFEDRYKSVYFHHNIFKRDYLKEFFKSLMKNILWNMDDNNIFDEMYEEESGTS